jgi:RNA polymerase sigma-70 factor (ECF subfamily)
MDRIGLVFPELLAAAQAGQEWAWDRLVRSYGPAVLGYARSQGMADPEEVLGDVLVELVKGLRAFAGDEGNFRSWIFVIAHNRVVDARRRAGRRPTAEWPDGYEPAHEGARPLPYDLGDLRRRVDALPQLQRDVLLLRTVVGLSVDETADALGRAVGSVRVAHHRALQKLRQQISAEV